jgi:glucokinase
LILLGLDARPSRTLAVFVDEHGRVLSQSTHETIDDAQRATHDGQEASAVGVVAREGTGSGDRATVNPGAAIALAEQWTGAARGARCVVGLSLEGSVHAGVVLDGRLFGGAHGLAGAAGWLALNPVEREDYRKLGCFEAEVSEAGIVRRLVWRIKSGDDSSLQEVARGNLSAITVADIFDAARKGDGVAISIVRDTAKYIGMAVANFITIMDPDVVVLGGAIAEARDLLLDPARNEISRRVSKAAGQAVEIVPPALGEQAAAIGAARAGMIRNS